VTAGSSSVLDRPEPSVNATALIAVYSSLTQTSTAADSPNRHFALCLRAPRIDHPAT